jgi:hypothetical protein
VTLHFHPDRLVAGTPILERMARDGVYRSQFETGTSNGGLTAHPDGDRWRLAALRLSLATAASIRESSETPLAPAGITISISNGSGITWPGSAPPEYGRNLS